MFGLLKAVVGAATLPVDAVADVVNEIRTIGDPPHKKPESHVKNKAAQIMRNLHDATE